MKKVAIMQPTYLPWVGYFALMSRVNVFVLLNNVQFARRSWQQRNQIKSIKGSKLLTVPVKKSGLRNQLISDVEMVKKENALEKHIRIINEEYKNAPYFKYYSQELFEILSNPYTHLADLNIKLILFIKNALDIKTDIVYSSALEVSGKKADLLSNICKSLNADQYIAPIGSKNYIDLSNAFSEKKISIKFHEYEQFEYSQLFGEFIPYMSTIDLLFNEGPRSKDIMTKGIK